MFLCVLLGGVGVVHTLFVPGGDCGLAAICCQLCLQPPAHLAFGHHGSHAADPPVFYRYKQHKPPPHIPLSLTIVLISIQDCCTITKMILYLTLSNLPRFPCSVRWRGDRGGESCSRALQYSVKTHRKVPPIISRLLCLYQTY